VLHAGRDKALDFNYFTQAIEHGVPVFRRYELKDLPPVLILVKIESLAVYPVIVLETQKA